MNSRKRKNHPVPKTNQFKKQKVEVNGENTTDIVMQPADQRTSITDIVMQPSDQKTSIYSIPNDVLSEHVFKFFTKTDRAKIKTTNKEWKDIIKAIPTNTKNQHVIKEYVASDSTDPSSYNYSPVKKIRLVGDLLDSQLSTKHIDRMYIEIYSKEPGKDQLKQTINTFTKLERELGVFGWGSEYKGELSDKSIIHFYCDNNSQVDQCVIQTVGSRDAFTLSEKKPLSQRKAFENQFAEALLNKKKEDALELLKHINNYNFCDKEGRPVLNRAYSLGYTDIVLQLIAKNDKVDNRFAEALLNPRKYEIALKLAKEAIDPNFIDDEGYPVLVRAASLGYYDIVEELVAKGADLELKASSSNTALVEAACNNNSDVMKYLIEKGADVNAQSSSGNTISHIIAKKNIDFSWEAISRGENQQQWYDLLKTYGVNPCITNLDDMRPADLSFTPMAVMTMDKDAENRVESWVTDSKRGCYHIKFKDVSYRDKIWAWEAIVNKIKSTAVDTDLGLADDKIESRFDNRRTQKAATVIPTRSTYAIESIRMNDTLSTLTIQIKPEFMYDSEVNEAIVKCLTDLRLVNAEKVEQQTCSARMKF